MKEPDDYGMSPLETLCHVANSTPPPGYQQLWINWNDHIWHRDAVLQPVDPQSSDAALGVTHTFRSAGDVQIGCRLILPKDKPVRGVVIATHGYVVEPDEPLTDDCPWSGTDLAVLKIRVRGYPGSQTDVGDLTAHPGGYITHGIESADRWVYSQAVADLVIAYRAAREQFGRVLPIVIHGESFGGGLAIVAASQIAGQGELFRLIIGLPSMGDWPWRLRHNSPAGIGFDVAEYLKSHSEHESQVLENLRLFDAVVHARRLRSPAVFKLAERDEVVPAPSAAAIYNALGTAPGLKWRFVVKYGHFDGGVGDLRRHAEFEKLARDFADPARYPQELMKSWEPKLPGYPLEEAS